MCGWVWDHENSFDKTEMMQSKKQGSDFALFRQCSGSLTFALIIHKSRSFAATGSYNPINPEIKFKRVLVKSCLIDLFIMRWPVLDKILTKTKFK